MSLTVRELKKSDLWINLNTFFEHKDTSQRIGSLVLLITYLKNPEVKTKLELYNKSASVERDLDDFYIKFKYSEYIHKEECDYLRCCFKLKHLLDEHQLSVNEVFPLLNLFSTKLTEMYQ